MKDKIFSMFEHWFGSRKSLEEDAEEKRRQEVRDYTDRKKREQDGRDHITAELNHPELEEVSLKIYKLHGLLADADPIDLAYAKPDPEKAAAIRKEIDRVVLEHGETLAAYIKLKREKYAEAGISNPGYVDAEVASELFSKGLMEEWRWESDPRDRFWEQKKEE